MPNICHRLLCWYRCGISNKKEVTSLFQPSKHLFTSYGVTRIEGGGWFPTNIHCLGLHHDCGPSLIFPTLSAYYCDNKGLQALMQQQRSREPDQNCSTAAQGVLLFKQQCCSVNAGVRSENAFMCRSATHRHIKDIFCGLIYRTSRL